MSVACLLLASLLSAAYCPPEPPEQVRLRGEAVRLRPSVELALETANAVLQGAGEAWRLVPSWQLGNRGAEADEIIVYLVKSPATIEMQAKQRKIVSAAAAEISKNTEGIAEDAEGCGDLDECIRSAYPRATIDMAYKALEFQNSVELAMVADVCGCIMLIEHDLEIFRIVFGADWDYLMLLSLFPTEEEFTAALDAGRIPDILLDGQPLTLEAMLVFLVLHEVGHLSGDPFEVPEGPQVQGLQRLLSGIGAEKTEELRADSFAAKAIGKACVGMNPQGRLRDACYGPASLSAFTFLMGMKGKSREAVCLRYLDTNRRYPNWRARLLIADFVSGPDSRGGRENLRQYLETREALLSKHWIEDNPTCARMSELSVPMAN